ncbi:MAG: hypothetical protein AVDCRST_MAG07-1966, partial [uncultured Frankineae bacterium]
GSVLGARADRSAPAAGDHRRGPVGARAAGMAGVGRAGGGRRLGLPVEHPGDAALVAQHQGPGAAAGAALPRPPL